jgi:hypothetical protein
MPPETPPSQLPGKKSLPDRDQGSVDKSKQASGPDPGPAPAQTPAADPDRGNKMADHLKSFFGVQGKEPASAGNQTAQGAVDDAVKGVQAAPTGNYGGG